MDALKVSHLKKSFKQHFYTKREQILKDISFEVQKGHVTGFLGANGAGKTTTIKCLLGLIYPDQGEIEFFGQNKLSANVKKRIGFLPERPYFYDHLSGREFLRFYGEITGGYSRSELERRIEELIERVRLSHAIDRKLRGYSKGMLQRVGIAQALIHKPEFVILDEPMGGLDPDGRMEVFNIIKETAALGTTVFFSSHLLHDAEKLCDDLIILKKGQKVFQGTMNELLGRVKAEILIIYMKNGEEKIKKCASREEGQRVLDELRDQGCEIIEYRQEKVSLEEAFVEIAFDEVVS